MEPAPGGRRAGEEGVTADCLVEGISDPLLAEHVVAEIGASGDTGPTTAGEPAIGVDVVVGDGGVPGEYGGRIQRTGRNDTRPCDAAPPWPAGPEAEDAVVAVDFGGWEAPQALSAAARSAPPASEAATSQKVAASQPLDVRRAAGGLPNVETASQLSPPARGRN